MALLKRQSDKVDVLRKVPLLADLSKKELALVARNTTEATVKSGTPLMRQGELGQEAMVILSGTAEVKRNGRKIKELGPGDVMGEISLVTNAHRTADVTASSDLQVLVADAREFSTILDQNPKVAVKVMKTIADRLAELEAGQV